MQLVSKIFQISRLLMLFGEVIAMMDRGMSEVDFNEFQFTVQPTNSSGGVRRSGDWCNVISSTKLPRYGISVSAVVYPGQSHLHDSVKFVTGASYEGLWSTLGMDGAGCYKFPFGKGPQKLPAGA